MPRRHAEDISVGEDSFLDTTANLVGILIILVVIIGSKTKVDAEAYGRELAAQTPTQQLEDPEREARALHASLAELSIRQQEYELETQYRKSERDALLTQITLARGALEEKMASLDADKRSSIEKEQEREKLESQLKAKLAQMGAAEEAKPAPIVLEHLPTPMAKTVFSRELHVMLQNSRVTVIPWDRLVNALKEQVPLAARRNASRSALDDTLGPIGGWLMKYRMLAVPGGFELDHFELESISPNETETFEDALAPGGRLQLELATRNPAETVITVWIYPDSFDLFRQLKAKLFEAGFLSAARPLPEGMKIGASPRGSRSTAQ